MGSACSGCSCSRGYKVFPHTPHPRASVARRVPQKPTLKQSAIPPPTDELRWKAWAALQKWEHYRYWSFDGMGNQKSSLHHPDSESFKDLIKKKDDKEGYKISKKVLGVGGFSSVKLATKKSTSTQVAVKITSNKDSEAQREVELLTFLGADHENICNLVDFYPKGKELYMIFEYCTGGDIMDLVHDNDRLTEREGANVARCICSALAFCHTKNIAHRDIKGENVLCFRATEISPLRCKLADWGCATYFASYEETFSQKIGSSCYMAPEVVKECYLPAKADVWSLGATVWTVLHGEPPFRGPTHDITFQRMLTETLQLPKSISVGTSTCCQHFILSTMNRRAWKRPLADTLLNHPWLQELADGDSYPEMEVPKQMDPKSIPDDEVLRMPQG